MNGPMGTQDSLAILRTSLGAGVAIHAFDFKSYAGDVADFIRHAATVQHFPQIDADLIPRFRRIRRVVGFFNRLEPQ